MDKKESNKPRIRFPITLDELMRLDRLYLPAHLLDTCHLEVTDISQYRPAWLQRLWEEAA